MLRNVTFSAEERLIQKARSRAMLEHQSLNALFRKWLEEYAKNQDEGIDYRQIMKKLSYVTVGRKFSRDELNER